MPHSRNPVLAVLASTISILALAIPAPGQTDAKPTGDVTFHFETGSPPWTGERIDLPPSFARDLGWNGVEEIRFAPGMFRPGETDFFSYILVFVLEPGADISEEGLKKELLTYYRGLSKAVMGSAGLTVETDGFSVSIEKAEGAEPSPPLSAPDAAGWTAVLEWIEPFATSDSTSDSGIVRTSRSSPASCWMSPTRRQSSIR